MLELAGLLADAHHLADHRREGCILDQRLSDRGAVAHALTHFDERLLDHVVARRLAGDLERLDDVDARRDESRERAREARHRDLEDRLSDLERKAEAQAIPDRTPEVALLPAEEAEDAAPERREDDEPVVTERVRRRQDVLGERRQLAVQLFEDPDEDRDDEEEHAGEDE